MAFADSEQERREPFDDSVPDIRLHAGPYRRLGIWLILIVAVAGGLVALKVATAPRDPLPQPGTALDWVLRAHFHLDNGDFAKAIAACDEAIRLDPNCALAYVTRGEAHQFSGQHDLAIADYGAALRVDPLYVPAYRNRGNLWLFKREYAKAIRDYDETIRLDPNHAADFSNRGLAYYFKKEFAPALTDYDNAIRLEPNHAWARLGRATALMLMRRPESVQGFTEFIDLQGWQGELTPYAVILGHIAARQAGDEPGAQRFLTDAKGKLNLAWPNPEVRFLRGEIDEPALLALAIDNDKRTEAHCLLGLTETLKGRTGAALAHFRWVRDHGTPSFIEIAIAAAELDRLEMAPEAPKP